MNKESVPLAPVKPDVAELEGLAVELFTSEDGLDVSVSVEGAGDGLSVGV